jgi:hypothetical protein
MARTAQKQTQSAPFASDAEAGTLLGRDFIAAVVVFHDLVGRCLGVSATDRKCLDLLSRGPVTAGQLARFTGLTTGAVTGIIDRLVKVGYAERISDLPLSPTSSHARARSCWPTLRALKMNLSGNEPQQQRADETPATLTA